MPKKNTSKTTSPTPTQEEETSTALTLQINNPDYIIGLRDLVIETMKEMESINVNNTPIKNITRDKWLDAFGCVKTFLVKIVPVEE